MAFHIKYLIILAFSFFLGASQAMGATARIEMVGKGSLVKVTRAGSTVQLKAGDALQAGDTVVTDANTAVDLRLEDDTLIRVGVSSSYKLEEDSKIKQLVHRLLSGVVRVLVPPSEKKGAGIKFRMYTSEGTIGVRGTEFVVLRKEGNTQLRGLSGEVIFGPADTEFSKADEFVPVTAGFWGEVLPGGKPSKPEKFNLQQYRDEINRADSPFGPLAARQKENKRHQRAEAAPLAVAKAPSGKAEERPKLALPKPSREVREKVDYQYMLAKAASDGDKEAIDKALKGGADINARVGGSTALQYALAADKEEAFVHLIEKGASVNLEDEDGLTPLMYVAKFGLKMKYALALVHPGAANIDYANKAGETATALAKASNHKELWEYLEGPDSVKDYEKGLKHQAKLEEERRKQAEKDAAELEKALLRKK